MARKQAHSLMIRFSVEVLLHLQQVSEAMTEGWVDSHRLVLPHSVMVVLVAEALAAYQSLHRQQLKQCTLYMKFRNGKTVTTKKTTLINSKGEK